MFFLIFFVRDILSVFRFYCFRASANFDGKTFNLKNQVQGAAYIYSRLHLAQEKTCLFINNLVVSKKRSNFVPEK